VAIGKYVAKCGVSECVENDPGDGVRQMRVPLVSDGTFPITIDQRCATAVSTDVSAVSSAVFLSASPATLPVEGLDLVNLFLLTDLGIYKQ
jgi:hypothetical protein